MTRAKFAAVSAVGLVLIAAGGVALALANRRPPAGAEPPPDDARAVLKGHGTWAMSLTFSPDGKTLAAPGKEGQVRLWDPATGREATALEGGVVPLAFSPDGRTLVTGGAGSRKLTPPGQPALPPADDALVRLWRVAGGERTATFQVPPCPPPYPQVVDFVSAASAAFSPDGKTLAVGVSRRDYDHGPVGAVVLWNLATGQVAHVRRPTPGVAGDVAPGFSAALPWAFLRSHGSFGFVPAVAYVLGGAALASTDGRDVSLWDVAGDRERGLLAAGDRPEGASYACLAASADGVLVAAGEARPARFGRDDLPCRAIVWDAATGRRVAALGGHAGAVLAVAFRPDGKALATAGADGVVRLWDLPGGTESAALRGHEGAVLAAAFSPDGKTLATGGQDGTVRLWDVPAK